jgi:hypothetical protein
MPPRELNKGAATAAIAGPTAGMRAKAAPTSPPTVEPIPVPHPCLDAASYLSSSSPSVVA